MMRWLAGEMLPAGTGRDNAVISVPGSIRDARIYPLCTWRPVLEALRNPDWRDLSAVPRDSALFGPTYQHEQSLLRRTPPRATQLRDALNPGFSRGSLERYRPAIRAQARALLGRVRPGQGSADLASEWCEPLIAYAVTVTTGMTRTQWARLRELTDRANAPILSPGDHAGMEQAQAELRAYYAPVIAGARAGQLRAARGEGPPSRTLVSGAVAALDGLGLPPGEVVNTLQAFFGGFASAVPVLACMTLESLLLPEVLEQCRAHAELVPAAVREHLRRSCHFTFAQPGVARRPIEAEGRVIQPGSVVIPMIHAAEHDPGRTPEPGRYDLFRPRRAILAFGAGVHHCPGRAWVELLLQEAFRALAEDRSGLRLAAPETVRRGTAGLVPGGPAGIRIPVTAACGPPAGATAPLAWRDP